MIAYTKDGKDYLLSANTKHGVIKIPTAEFASAAADHAAGSRGTGGSEVREDQRTKDVVQLDKLDDARAIMLIKTDGPAST